MGGLFDIFRRHFVVLTKFPGNGVESRPIARRRHSKGPGQGGDHRYPTGPAGWSRSRPRRIRSPGSRNPPTPPPAGATGPAPLVPGPSPSSRLGVPVLPLPYPPRYTHPVYPPGPVPASHGSHVTAGTVRGTRGTCTYGRFETVVGEPRGMRTHTGLALFWHCLALLRLCTAV